MRYVQTTLPTAPPRLLDVAWEQNIYSLNILHAALEEHRTRGNDPHQHDLYHIVLYTRGRDRFNLNDRLVPVQSGDLAISSPGEPHDFGPVDGSQMAYREVTFELKSGIHRLAVPFRMLMAQYLGQPVSEVAYPVRLEPRTGAPLHDLFRILLERLCGKTPFEDLAAHATLSELFARIAAAVYGREDLFDANVSPVDQARRLIDRQAATSLGLDDLAEQVRLSPAHLCRQFKVRFGQSPMAYHQSQRVLAAQRLLSTTTLSCKEIAMNLGFSDVYTFSKAFKRVAGLAPSQYKRNA
jgi:AraC-like DNA-binding protein/mannose-6-phosphate isomerase-like protein (cupin superfamily)